MAEKEDTITLPQVGDVSKTVAADVDEINAQTGRAFNLYESIINRAEKGVPEHLEWNFDADQAQLEEIGVDDTKIPISSEAEQNLHNIESPETVSFDSETVADYVEDITSRIDEVRTARNGLESRIESAERISQEAFSDFVESTQLLEGYDKASSALEGSYGEKLEQHLSAREGRVETRKAIENMTTNLRSEQIALQNELADVVNKYVSEAYDRASTLSEELGGTARPREGEIDLLSKIADSRGEIIQNRGNPEDYEFVPPELAAQSALSGISKEAMEKQAALVAQVSSQMGKALDESYEIIDTSEQYIRDSEDIAPSQESVNAMREGYSRMSDITDEEDHETFSDAIRSIMQNGMAEDEEFDDEYSFAMDDIPYMGSSEQEGGRL